MRRAALAPLLAALLLPLTPFAASTGGSPQGASCVQGLEARADGDGSVVLRWAPVPGATAYRIHRTEVGRPESPTSFLVPAPGTGFHDAGTGGSATYRYMVLPDPAPPEGAAACEGVEVTVIPYSDGLRTALNVAAVAALGYLLVAGTRRTPVSRR
jgi:hypothetical protein